MEAIVDTPWDIEVIGEGISIGTLGLEVADVGRDGMDNRSVVKPGIRIATTLLID